MSTNKHTPGPWEYVPEQLDPSGSRVAGRGPVVKVEQFAVAKVCRTAYRRGREPEGEANARLIAAAPDLLANLKATLQQLEDARLTHEQVCNGVHADSGTCEGEYIYARFLQHTRDLIAKAEGTTVSSRSP